MTGFDVGDYTPEAIKALTPEQRSAELAFLTRWKRNIEDADLWGMVPEVDALIAALDAA